jgi:hypothetical protein
MHSLTHSPTHSLAGSVTHSVSQPVTYSLTRWLNQSLAQSLIHSPTHSHVLITHTHPPPSIRAQVQAFLQDVSTGAETLTVLDIVIDIVGEAIFTNGLLFPIVYFLPYMIVNVNSVTTNTPVRHDWVMVVVVLEVAVVVALPLLLLLLLLLMKMEMDCDGDGL